MTRILVTLAVILTVLAAGLAGCNSDSTTSATTGEGVVNGVVTDASTGTVLAGVAVQGQSISSGTQTATTDAQGKFSFTFTVDSVASITFVFAKTGYRDSTVIVGIRSGTVLALTFRLNPRSAVIGPGGGTGLAQTIAFLGADPSSISVYGVGGKETTILKWEVRDSLGLPIDAAHAVSLSFSSTNGPNGGEYISPPVLSTNAVGQAATTLNAGTRSGVVQILASASVSGRTISSSPVQVVINGGFPVQSHFSIGPEQFNFPALGSLGKMLGITVLVGDVYSNPVAKGTAVYFRSGAGVVQPSVFTDGNGEGSVSLISGNPAPLGVYAASAFGDGYHYVVARTLGQNATPVQDSILVLWSGAGLVDSLSPGSFDIPNQGSLPFSFRVADVLGHPLARGTSISVVATIPPPTSPGAEQNQVFVEFGTNGSLVLGDLIFPGPGSTRFSFVLKDGSWNITDPTPVNLSISVTGPNVVNPISRTIGGIVR